MRRLPAVLWLAAVLRPAVTEPVVTLGGIHLLGLAVPPLRLLPADEVIR